MRFEIIEYIEKGYLEQIDGGYLVKKETPDEIKKELAAADDDYFDFFGERMFYFTKPKKQDDDEIANDIAMDEFEESKHPRNNLGQFIKKLKGVLFKDKTTQKKEGSIISNVFLSETGDLSQLKYTKREIQKEIEKELLPDNIEELEKMYDEVDFLHDEYSLGGELTSYAIEYKKRLINNKIKKLNEEAKELVGKILDNSIKRVPTNKFDDL